MRSFNIGLLSIPGLIVLLFVAGCSIIEQSSNGSVICKRNLISLSQFKQNCHKDSSLFGEYMEYINDSPKTLESIRMDNGISYSIQNFNLSNMYPNIKIALSESFMLRNFSKHIHCDTKNTKLKILYTKDRAIATCAFSIPSEFRFEVYVLIKDGKNIKIIPISSEGGTLAPDVRIDTPT